MSPHPSLGAPRASGGSVTSREKNIGPLQVVSCRGQRREKRKRKDTNVPSSLSLFLISSQSRRRPPGTFLKSRSPVPKVGALNQNASHAPAKGITAGIRVLSQRVGLSHILIPAQCRVESTERNLYFSSKKHGEDRRRRGCRTFTHCVCARMHMRVHTYRNKPTQLHHLPGERSRFCTCRRPALA